jgi:predicted GH43/DUF377 family glycosyl hydrolase
MTSKQIPTLDNDENTDLHEQQFGENDEVILLDGNPSAKPKPMSKSRIISVIVLVALFVIALLLVIVMAVIYNTLPTRNQFPQITVTRLRNTSIISADNSQFTYNYNTAFFPSFESGVEKYGLMVRVQNTNSTNPYDVLNSKLAVATSSDGYSFSTVTNADVVFGNDHIAYEDPRIVYYNDIYYMFYTKVTFLPNGDARADLALATCSDKTNMRKCWIDHGPILLDQKWSKSGALLVQNSGSHYLFWGDTNIYVAKSVDLKVFNNTEKILIATRPGQWDSELVESGPEPIQLEDGNYLFLYNSAVKGVPSNKPNWNLQYNIGYVILDGTDPTKILYRSSVPILSPVLDWETCDKIVGLTPNVVFISAWKKISSNKIMLWYQGCDAWTGVAVLDIDYYK